MAGEQYLVFARKWRPQSFDDVVGQEHITRTLQNAIASGRIGHAFLFVGSRGIGKTTTARILAKALNCLSSDAPTTTPCGVCANCTSISEGNSMDVIEIDGASNNSVDDVREIRENVRLVPSRSRYKVYIIDEVHQLSASAFNALLKTLEEPPPHAIFILATTEAHRVLPTVVSRCQRFDFRRVPVPEICKLLRAILDKEGIRCTDEALQAVARAAEGGVRDSESILDQLVSYCDGEITFRDVFDVLGLVDWDVMHRLCDAILAQDVGTLLGLVEDVVAAGKDLSQFVQDVLQYFRNLLVCKTGNAKQLLALPDEEIAGMQAHAEKFTLTNLIRLVEQFAELTRGFDSQVAQRIAIEALLIRISKRSIESNADTVIEKIMQLRESMASGQPVAAPVAAPKPDNAPPSQPSATAHSPAPAPPQPAKPKRGEVTPANMAAAWARIAASACEDDMGLRVALDLGKAVAIDGDCLVIEFAADVAEACAAVEKEASRRAVIQAIETLTANLHTFRTSVADPAAAPVAKNAQTVPASSRIKADEAKAALQDPHVAKVVEVFRGEIVDIIDSTGD